MVYPLGPTRPTGPTHLPLSSCTTDNESGTRESPHSRGHVPDEIPTPSTHTSCQSNVPPWHSNVHTRSGAISTPHSHLSSPLLALHLRRRRRWQPELYVSGQRVPLFPCGRLRAGQGHHRADGGVHYHLHHLAQSQQRTIALQAGRAGKSSGSSQWL